MLYAIISQDVENSLEKRLSARPDHIARLTELDEAKRLVLAGPHPTTDSNEPGTAGFTGSLVVAQFETLEQATKWANTDPYVTSGVYQSVTIKPFKQIFPK
jgi:uncharacterized protein YciI